MKLIMRYLIIVTVFFILSGIIVYALIPTLPHQFKEDQCGFCHITYEAPLQFRDNITTLCNNCHGNDKALSHIVGIKPSMQVPDDFRLDSNQSMTCATCHNVHMDRIDTETNKRTYLLRRKFAGKEFCNLCHNDVSKIVNASKHADVIQTAHFGYYDALKNDRVDRVSLACIGCHEMAKGKGGHILTKRSYSSGNSNHPMGMDYMTSQAYKSKQLRSVRALSSDIKLYGGKVGCASCHNPFKMSKNKLHNEESKMCVECHLL